MMYNDYVQLIANCATALGVPFAIILFLREKRKEREDEIYRAYSTVDEKYVEFQKLCLQFPNLGCHLQDDDNKQLSREQEIQRLAIYEILMANFERSFLLYEEKNNKKIRKQWSGWDDYIHMWLQKDSFRRAWEIEGGTWDADFMNYMNRIYQKYKYLDSALDEGNKA